LLDRNAWTFYGDAHGFRVLCSAVHELLSAGYRSFITMHLVAFSWVKSEPPLCM
jgi:hypothetical protein